MATDTALHSMILKIVSILPLLMMAVHCQMCLQERTKIMTVKRNGRLERVPMKTMVKDCCEGYVMDENNPTACVSLCHDGFVLVDGECIPNCENCENGECLAPDECKCNDGYMETTKGCQPICDECINAVCIKPGICECKEGFVSTPNGCVPSPCQGCENGICLKTGECQCSMGYRWSNRDHKCKAKCKHRCRNGYCSAPNQCSCYEGYQKLPNKDYVCIPKKWYDETTNDENNDGDDDDAGFGNDYDDNFYAANLIDERKWRKFLKIAPEKSPLLVILKKNLQFSFCLPSEEKTFVVCITDTSMSNKFPFLCILLSVCLFTTAQTKICKYNVTKLMPVKVNNSWSKKYITKTKFDCCEGYKPDPSKKASCIPICEEGFAYSIDKGCLPNCPENCTNGICLQPGICQCEIGFQYSSTEGCVPEIEGIIRISGLKRHFIGRFIND
ncbi:uncharacterized protein [Musca autumnalis]|uniref:uncharacterized protein n=1 Tax=Musca autumnalis TaxID=221902 RepID=UPI003CF4455C